MGIVIEHDTVATTSTVPSGPVVQSEAENGGRAVEAAGASDHTDAEDAGGPPQWLLDAVKQAMTEEGSASAGTSTDALDGGAASA